MNNDEIRVKIDKKEQRKIFIKFNNKFDNHMKASIFLKINKGTYKNYLYCKTRYLPKTTINKILSHLKIKNIKILDSKTLKEIRQKTIKKTYPILKKKYGKNYMKVISSKGHYSLEKTYGKNWRKILALKGYKTSRRKYGKNFQRDIWKKAIKTLEGEYGKDWAKINASKSIKTLRKKYGKSWKYIVMKKARRGHYKKLGRDWPKIISNKGKKALEKKYGKNYRKKLYELSNMLGKHPLTKTETKLSKLLKKHNISFETHHTKNNTEFDIVIPNGKNPKIIIEVSDAIPTTINSRIKLIQLLNQKKVYPNSVHICILKSQGYMKNKKYHFNPGIRDFLIENDFKLFWIDEMTKVIENIKSYLKVDKERFTNFKASEYTNEAIFLRNSKGGAFANNKKQDKNSKKLYSILINTNPKTINQLTLKTKFDVYVSIDCAEKLNNQLILYEITDSKTQAGTRMLAGKIAFLKNSLNNPSKFIVILNKRNNLIERVGDRQLKEQADEIILKNNFNEKEILNVRNNLLSES